MVYRQLSTEERYHIAALRKLGRSARQIAAELDRHPSTVAREVKRNATPYDGAYRPSFAVEMTNGRRSRSRRNRRYEPSDFAAVEEHLRQEVSPEQVVGLFKRDGRPVMSHETIYLHIWADEARNGTLWQHLRGARKQRRKRYGRKDSRGRLAGKTMIGERPDIVAQRLRCGDWEGDTVHGKGKACVLTLVDRKSGLIRIAKLPGATADEATQGTFRQLLGELHPVHSITTDNGSEFHGFKDIERLLGTKVYFATPHHAWERGTNENTNGLVRQYLPKGTCLADLTQEQCDAIAAKLNHRPRKRHGFLSPHDVYYQSVLPTRRSVASCGKLFGSCPRKRPIR
jgi:IS30 family transposase